MAFTRKCKSHRSRCCAAGLGHSCQEAVARSYDNAFRCESRSRKMQHCDQKADHQGPASRNGQSRSRTASHFRTPTGQRQSWTCLDAPHRKSSRSLESTDYSLSNTTKRVCCRTQSTTSRMQVNAIQRPHAESDEEFGKVDRDELAARSKVQEILAACATLITIDDDEMSVISDDEQDKPKHKRARSAEPPGEEGPGQNGPATGPFGSKPVK